MCVCVRVCQYLSKCVKFLKDYVNISKFLRISTISHIFQANDIPIHPSRTEEETYKIPYKLIPITAHTHTYIYYSPTTSLHSSIAYHTCTSSLVRGEEIEKLIQKSFGKNDPKEPKAFRNKVTKK